jgi:hypothetical protein
MLFMMSLMEKKIAMLTNGISDMKATNMVEMTKPDLWKLLSRPLWFEDYIGALIDSNQDLGTNERLQQIFDQYPDWDGYGANPVNAESFLRVRDFVMKLPDDVEKPEVAPEPDGDVVMVWTKDGRHVCIVGIAPTGKLIIAVPRDRQMYWPISTKYELYAWLQAAYRE